MDDVLASFREDVANELAQQIKDASNAEPVPQNYSILVPGPKGLTVVFQPYQVAPYAMGSPEVRIPYANLKEILNPNIFGQ